MYYGVLIVIYQSAGVKVDWQMKGKFKSVIAWLIMLALIVFGWMIFRAPSLAWLVNVLTNAPVFGSEESVIVGVIALSMTCHTG